MEAQVLDSMDIERERGITILMVTHEDEVAKYATRSIRVIDGLVAQD